MLFIQTQAISGHAKYTNIFMKLCYTSAGISVRFLTLKMHKIN